MSLLGLLCSLGSVFPLSGWVTSGPLRPRPGATTSCTPCYAQGPLPTLAGLRLDLRPVAPEVDSTPLGWPWGLCEACTGVGGGTWHLITEGNHG